MKNWTCVLFLHETWQSGTQRKLFSLDEAGFMPHPSSPRAPLLPGAVDTEIGTLDLASVSQLGVILPWRHLAMSEDILGCHNWKMLLAPVGKGQGCC